MKKGTVCPHDPSEACASRDPGLAVSRSASSAASLGIKQGHMKPRRCLPAQLCKQETSKPGTHPRECPGTSAA